MPDLISFDRAHLWHPYAQAPPPFAPFPVVRAQGVRLTLADGRELIDGMSSWWSAIHGYNHPALNAAVTSQLQEMAHVMFGGLTHPPAVALAQLLVEITPPPLTRVFFTDSGSVAVEVALKMALQYWSGVNRPSKQRFLTVLGGYHGDTFAAMSLCDPITGMHHLFHDALPQQLFAPLPGPRFGERFEDPHIDDLKKLLERFGGEIAAVVIEPVVQGAGGMRFYAPAYLGRLRELCDEHEVLLIFDEIATGFGRTGQLFACQHNDITPDIMCVGKALTGGYLSLAATLCTEVVTKGVCQSEAGALLHGPTFMANPLACAVAHASTKLLLGQPWTVSVASIAQSLGEGLEPARTLPSVADVRVLGAIGVIEMADPIPDQVQAFLVERGIWLRPFGRLLYTMPPYVIDEFDLNRITQTMVEAARLLGNS